MCGSREISLASSLHRASTDALIYMENRAIRLARFGSPIIFSLPDEEACIFFLPDEEACSEGGVEKSFL